MFAKSIFETLPIAIIAASILLMVFLHHPIALFAGITLIIGSCYIIYKRVNAIGLSTQSDSELTPVS